MNKMEADDLRKIEVKFLKKHGYFSEPKEGIITWTSSFNQKSSIDISSNLEEGNSHINIYYTQGGGHPEKEEFHYKVQLTTTPCNLGGKRYWFLCPLSKEGKLCGKRVSVLYKGGDYFGCRHCYSLRYYSQRVPAEYRSLVAMLKTLKKLQ